MHYSELAAAARGNIGPFCKACPVCDGRACGSLMPGPGAKGRGRVAVRNYDAWDAFPLAMDPVHVSFEASTRTKVLGHDLALPVLIGPVGDVNRHYGEKYTTVEYNSSILRAAQASGTYAFTGDGLDPAIMTESLRAIQTLGGAGIPTIKPWAMGIVQEKLEAAKRVKPVAIAMDVDAAGLPFLKHQDPPAGFKDVGQLREIADQCHDAGVPLILKGIMSPLVAEKAVDAGADAIIVSNHGGRVLDGVPSTAEVLLEVSSDVDGDVEVLVDGGVRSGVDVFRALALGARAVLMARPFVVAVYGGGEQGARDYLAQLADELADTMEMCGAETVADVDEDMLTW